MSICVSFLPVSQISLSVNLMQITDHVPTKIGKHWCKQKQMKYLTKRHAWIPSQHTTVDWVIFYNTIQTLTKNKR